jgi:hypothetical protein
MAISLRLHVIHQNSRKKRESVPMRVELYGLTMESPGVTFYLWSPWRCSAIEHRLFESVRAIPGLTVDNAPDEVHIEIDDVKIWKQAVQNMARVLKGWQEEATDAGTEKRSWRWLLEADTDSNGYDTQAEKSCFWAFVRLSLDRGSPGNPEKGEDVDLNGFGVCFWGNE